jgi:hypothetical protein
MQSSVVSIFTSRYVSYNPTPTVKMCDNSPALLSLFCRLSGRREYESARDISTRVAGRDLNVERFREDFRSREHGLAFPAHFSILCGTDLEVGFEISKRTSNEIMKGWQTNLEPFWTALEYLK